MEQQIYEIYLSVGALILVHICTCSFVVIFTLINNRKNKDSGTLLYTTYVNQTEYCNIAHNIEHIVYQLKVDEYQRLDITLHELNKK